MAGLGFFPIRDGWTHRPGLNTLFVRGRMRGWDDVHPMFGDKFYSLNGKRNNRGEKITREEGRMPAVLDNQQVVMGDLIPITSFGSSLANMLTKKSWDALRHPLIEANHNICQCCGQWKKTLDVHEVWGYDFPPEDEIAKSEAEDYAAWGVQRLEGLMGLCKDCHACFHLGKAQIDGVMEEVSARLGALNHWTPDVLDRYLDCVFDRAQQSKRVNWVLDLGRVIHPEGGITIKSDWTQHEEDGRLLVAENQYIGTSITSPMHIPWRLQGEKAWREPIMAEQLLAEE